MAYVPTAWWSSASFHKRVCTCVALCAHARLVCAFPFSLASVPRDHRQEQLRFKSSSPEALRAIAATPRGEWVVCGGISGKCFIWQVRGAAINAAAHVMLRWMLVLTCGAHSLSPSHATDVHGGTSEGVESTLQERLRPSCVVVRHVCGDRRQGCTGACVDAGGCAQRLATCKCTHHSGRQLHRAHTGHHERCCWLWWCFGKGCVEFVGLHCEGSRVCVCVCVCVCVWVCVWVGVT